MKQKLTIAVIGAGDFANDFVITFKAHPLVEKVYICDLIRSRAESYARLYGVEIIDSFEDALKDKSINCIAIFVQRHLHYKLTKEALFAGKHVYSAVPMATSVEECAEIIDAVKKTGLTYMMGETCCYYPCSIYCRKKYSEGVFGKFIYGEAQYYHDLSHFPKTFLNDLSSAGIPPFYYATHSISMILSATKSRVEKIVAFGYEDREDDGVYEKGVNQWDNVFSNEFALMKLANGGTARINECRRIGYKAPSSYISAFYGTEGAYQFSNAQHLLTTKTEKGVKLYDVSDEINPIEMTRCKDIKDFSDFRGNDEWKYGFVSPQQGDKNFKELVANHGWQHSFFSPQQDYKKLPKELDGIADAHMASHKFLVDEFCNAVYFNKTPAVNAWVAARYTIPGLLAHESAKQDGMPITVPDFGDAPE